MNAIQMARKEMSNIKRQVERYMETLDGYNVESSFDDHFSKIRRETYDKLVAQRERAFREECMYAAKLVSISKSVFKAETQLQLEGTPDQKMTKTYALTIRPNEGKETIESLYAKFEDLRSRNWCENIYFATFEQIGKNPEDYGKGLHLNVVIRTTKGSKKELLRGLTGVFVKRDIDESYNMSENNIHVRNIPTKGDYDNYVTGYLTEYRSADGHKEDMKPHDEQWRMINNIPHDISAGFPRVEEV